MDVIEAIHTKRATREFSGQEVSDEDIRTVLEAGRRAQSSHNLQPWDFVVIRDRETLRRLSELGTYAGHLAGAAFGIALVSPVEDSSEISDFDMGQAAAYMQLAGWDLGIGSCLAAMWEPDKARQVLGIPEDRRFELAISFGYPMQEAATSQGAGRRPLEDMVHCERW